MKRCDICEGARVIKLPVRRELVVSDISASLSLEMDEAYRTYPCPQCAEQVGIGVMQACAVDHDTSKKLLDGSPGFRGHVHSGIARDIGARLLKDGLIRFEGRDTDYQPRYGGGGKVVRGTVIVAPPIKIDTLAEKVAENQLAIATRAALIMLEEVQVWGSEIGVGSLTKPHISRIIRDALQKVIAAKSEWREWK